MMTLIIMIAVGVGVAALIGGIAVTLRTTAEGTAAEDRLSTLTGQKARDKSKADAPSLLNNPLGGSTTFADQVLARLGNVAHLMEQADVQMSASKFLTILRIGRSWRCQYLRVHTRS